MLKSHPVQPLFMAEVSILRLGIAFLILGYFKFLLGSKRALGLQYLLDSTAE